MKRNPEHTFSAALYRAIVQDDGRQLRRAAEKLLAWAAKGEAWAIKELADRLDGRPPQAIGIGNTDGSPLTGALIIKESERKDGKA